MQNTQASMLIWGFKGHLQKLLLESPPLVSGRVTPELKVSTPAHTKLQVRLHYLRQNIRG